MEKMTTTGTMRLDLLACPHCLSELRCDDNGLACAECREVYPIIDGIPCFAPTDCLYDDYAIEHCPYAVSPKGVKDLILRILPFWSWREWRFWRSAVPPCDRLLDLGCGRGRELFTEYARETVGFDGSLRFIRDCATHYDAVALGDLPQLPFRSGMFDAVVSSHVLGHVPIEHKDKLISEIARSLRPGGTTVHIIETDSEHPVIVAAKRKPETYRKQFVEQDGHIGLEPAPLVLERFKRHGFRLATLRLVDAIVPSLLNFRKYLDHPDFGDLPGVSRLHRIERWTKTSRVVNAGYEVGMGAFHLTIEQWMGDPRWAQFILVSFVKTTAWEKEQR